MIQTERRRRRPPNAWPAPGVRDDPGGADPAPRPWPGWAVVSALALAALLGWVTAFLVGYGGWVVLHGVRDALPWGGTP